MTRVLVAWLRLTQRLVRRRFPTAEAERRNASLQLTIDTIEGRRR